ncbi:MAG TPA: hypothetical protein VLI39_12840 [Sedimentisphaerales bacterium]|nr:hypothetical protein [Sedimentisphaerales bacterium]
MQIGHPDRIASQWRAGFGINVEGKPGTINWFHYDGEKLIAEHNDVNLSKGNPLAGFVVPDRPLILWGLGISIGVAFGVEMMDHHMDFIAAGCDFTLRIPL